MCHEPSARAAKRAKSGWPPLTRENMNALHRYTPDAIMGFKPPTLNLSLVPPPAAKVPATDNNPFGAPPVNSSEPPHNPFAFPPSGLTAPLSPPANDPGGPKTEQQNSPHDAATDNNPFGAPRVHNPFAAAITELSTDNPFAAAITELSTDNPFAPTSQPPPARLGQAFAYAQLAAVTDAFSSAHGIGEGSFGAVFRCTLPGLGLDCAVKVFKDDGAAAAAAAAASDGAARAMFEKEARALAAHPHPNFVQLLGTSVDGPRLCLVTAFMAGGCVRSRLTSGVLLTWRQRLTAAADACRGLAYLHGPQLGKVHRDVKPANILLDSAQVRGLRCVLFDGV